MESNSRPRIVVAHENGTEEVIELPDCLRIGRSSSNDLVITHQRVSRKHAEIRTSEQDRFHIHDVGSRNGTWVNGVRITSPKLLVNGDVIGIGPVFLTFLSENTGGEEPSRTVHQNTATMPTAMAMRDETVIVMVSDIRDFTSMCENLPRDKFQPLVSEWFRQNARIVEKKGAIVDKFIGDAVMVYWIVSDKDRPAREVNACLAAAREVVSLSKEFSRRVFNQFGTGEFRIGVGINMGEASIGNVGTGNHQSFTVVGDCVNVAFRLEALTKVKHQSVILSREVARWADDRFDFNELGVVVVKGRKEPVEILALELDTVTQR